MFLKPARPGGHTYLQLVESYRNQAGQPRQRTVASLGRLDEVGGGVDSLLAGLLRHKGLPASAALPSELEFDPALSCGDVSALDQIWCALGFDALAGVFRKAFTTAVEHAHAGLREEELVLLAHERDGLCTKLIASALNISENAINSRLQRMNAKLGVPNRKAAANLAAEYSLI